MTFELVSLSVSFTRVEKYELSIPTAPGTDARFFLNSNYFSAGIGYADMTL